MKTVKIGNGRDSASRHLLTENAAVPAQARISIMSLCQNNCNYEAVTTALRQSIGEQLRQVGNFGVIAEDEHGESELGGTQRQRHRL